MRKTNNFFVCLLVAVLLSLTLLTTACDAEDTENTGPAPEQATAEETQAEEPVADAAVSIEIDLESALKERVLGNPSAPIKITEFSSFTCSHCGEFHQNTFEAFKTNYLDTGKAYLISKEFIRNKVDMHAAATARCVSQMRYFDFIQMLFKRQEEWAYSPNYLDFLKERAAEYGVSEEMFNACVNSEALQTGVLDAMRASQTKFNIDSTPTFIVNDDQQITGALPYEAFDKAIQTIVTGKGTEENK